MGILGRLSRNMKSLADTLLTPAKDPRQVFTDTYQRQQELLRKVREAKANIALAKKRLEAKIGDVQDKFSRWEVQAEQSPFALQLRQIAAAELQALEEQVRALEHDERRLALDEERLVTQIEAFSARQEVLAARHTTAEARRQIREVLKSSPEEPAGLSEALEEVEHRSEDVQDRVSALEHMVEWGILTKPGYSIGDAAAQHLADRYASEAAEEHGMTIKQRLGLGFKALLGLIYEYEQLTTVLKRGKETDPLSAAYVPITPGAEETYRQGLSVLEDALELMRAIRSPSREELEAKIGDLEKEIESLSVDETPGTRGRSLKESLASHKERLEMLKQQEMRVDELLHQAGRCEAALHRTRIELAALKAGNIETSVTAVTEALLKTINRAREVQEELKKLGF